MLNAVDLIIDYESGLLDENETVDLFQELINSGLAWQLQGSYGRMATDLIREGYCQGIDNGVTDEKNN